VAAGIAAVILLAILVYAVVQTSDSSRTPPPLPFTSESATPSTYTTPSTTTTSYSVPQVTTSEDNPIVPGAPPPSSPEDDNPEATTDTPTFGNPYPTTTPTNAGHI
jgi:hypothetical protein